MTEIDEYNENLENEFSIIEKDLEKLNDCKDEKKRHLNTQLNHSFKSLLIYSLNIRSKKFT